MRERPSAGSSCRARVGVIVREVESELGLGLAAKCLVVSGGK
jgi:hypothetical protein